jgi:hypothetical protein
MMIAGWVCLAPISLYAQSVVADETDTAAFIDSTFQLQAEYATVHCVSADDTCPAEIVAAPPCLTMLCERAERPYPVAERYTTIQEAVDAAQPGDLIAVLPGRYAGVFVEGMGGEEGAYIHLLGIGGVIVDRAADPSQDWLRHHFYFVNVHHYIIDNITFTGSEDGAGIFFTGSFSTTGTFSHHLIVKNIYTHDHFRWGMHTTSTSQMLIQDSVFTGAADEHGLYISGSGDDIAIRRSIFQGNNAAGLQVNADPNTATAELFYWLQNSTGDTCGWSDIDVEFEGAARWSDIKDCYDSQNLPDLGAAIEDGISENLIIEQNIVTGNGAAGGAGINLASVRSSVVRSNLIYGNGAAGIACWDDAYGEAKGLAVSPFGCHAVAILNNTLVDQSGDRGALILSRDAQNLRVYNNIIVRDRYDAYEVTENAGGGLQSGWNYVFAQSVTDSPGFSADEESITGFSMEDALAQFVNPNFESWIVQAGDGYTLNPNRPDFHLQPGSPLATSGNSAFSPAGDLFGQPRGGEMGALTAE